MNECMATSSNWKDVLSVASICGGYYCFSGQIKELDVILCDNDVDELVAEHNEELHV